MLRGLLAAQIDISFFPLVLGNANVSSKLAGGASDTTFGRASQPVTLRSRLGSPTPELGIILKCVVCTLGKFLCGVSCGVCTLWSFSVDWLCGSQF